MYLRDNGGLRENIWRSSVKIYSFIEGSLFNSILCMDIVHGVSQLGS